MEGRGVSVNTLVLERNLMYRGEIVLHYRIEYPEFKSDRYQSAVNIINRYYAKSARNYSNYAETELYNMAVEDYNTATENGYPVRVFEVMQVFEVTYIMACIISLYFDRYVYTGGAHGITARTSQTWNLQRGTEVTLERLFRCNIDMKGYLMERIERQIRENPDIYFDDYRQLIEKYFREENFYCEPRGIVIYYQLYEIAPYASGIRTFLIPYDCFANPINLC
ncbi:MAG: DUF3298 and DUF4163 domain-containing protein [Eubacteriales bacterium]